MSRKKISKTVALSVMALYLVSFNSFAEETTGEKIKTKTNEAVDNTKETYRNAKNEICQMINGKEKCVKEKIKNKARNLKDKTGTKAEEIKDKVD